MISATRYRWDDLPTDHPMPLLTRRRILGEQMMISEIRLEPGFVLSSHHHENEQLVVMLQGHAIFTIGEDEDAYDIEVRTGDVLHLPSGVAHACRAIENCLILDLFSPVSENTGVDATPVSPNA